MNKMILAAALILAGAFGAAAQSFESQIAEASASITAQSRGVRRSAAAASGAFAAQGAPAEYAATIVCANPEASGLPPSLKFYTHLDGRRYVRRPVDDTASGLNDYTGSGLQDGKWRFNATSCDTQDYWFSFDAASLLKATAGETSRAIKGHARVETRGRVDWEGDLDCVANW